jgi:acetyl esterase/lipase
LLVLEDRLDPALRQFAAARTDLSPSVLGVVRNSLNQRRCETARGVNTVGVEIENREARSIPVRIYRGGPAPAPAVIYCHAGAFVLGNLDTDHPQCVEFARPRPLHRDRRRLSVGAGRSVSGRP